MTWPTVEEATGRINVLIEAMKEDRVGEAARDLIVVMRELGRVMDENQKLKEALKDARPYLVSSAHFQEDARANDIVFKIDAALKGAP